LQRNPFAAATHAPPFLHGLEMQRFGARKAIVGIISTVDEIK